jgi:hypothetical protein
VILIFPNLVCEKNTRNSFGMEAEPQPQPAAVSLTNLLSSDVGGTVLSWLCLDGDTGTVAVPSASRALCALRSTCAALAHGWHDADVLCELLSGRSRPADFAKEELGGFARQPWLPERVDAALGPRVPEDHACIADGLSAAAALVGTAPGAAAVTVRVAAGRYVITRALELPDGVRLVGSCSAGGAVVIQVDGCVGVTSSAWGAELVNLTFRTGSGSSAAGSGGSGDDPAPDWTGNENDDALDFPGGGELGGGGVVVAGPGQGAAAADTESDNDEDEDGGGEEERAEWGSCHCIFIHAGNLLLKDCDISCMAGCGVAIVCDRDAAAGDSAAALFKPEDPPRMLRCTVHGGGDVGVYIEGVTAVLTDCTVKDHDLSNVELLRSGAGTQLVRCRIEGGDEAGLHCCEGSSAALSSCHIVGSGMAGLVAQEAATINLCECTIRSGWEGGIMANGVNTNVVMQDSTVHFNAEVGVEAKERARVVLRKSSVRSNGTAGILSRLDGRVEIEECEISDNGLAGVEARETGFVQLASCTLSGVKPAVLRDEDSGCSGIQSLPAFLASHDSVGAGLFGTSHYLSTPLWSP